MDNLYNISHMASTPSASILKRLLKDLAKLLSLAIPSFDLKKLFALIKHLLREEEFHHQEEMALFIVSSP